jgi:menaquinol-cytochrome c reductase cytochrome b/c subunit
MTELPEHLRKRAEEARRKAEAKKGGGAAAEGASAEDSDKIPAHLLEGGQAGGDGGDGGAATGERAPAAAGGGGAAVATAPPPVATGAGGHTQRLLTVVKSGSIQDVRAKPVDKVHVWPHLLVVEFVAALVVTAFLLVFSAVVKAPLLADANFNLTPNPSKAPWYFLGLQELLTMFHPMVAGVTIPGMGIFGLILAPYIDRNPSNRPEDRKFAIALFTLFLMFWAVLVIIGSFFRGPGFNFVYPWDAGIFFDL